MQFVWNVYHRQKHRDGVCRLLSGPRVEWGQMINGSESVPWVDGNILKPDSSGISLGSQQSSSRAPVLLWGKGHFHCAYQMSSHLQSSEHRPNQGSFVFYSCHFYQLVTISFWQNEKKLQRSLSPFSRFILFLFIDWLIIVVVVVLRQALAVMKLVLVDQVGPELRDPLL